jgi:hypothetical protein
MRNGDWRGKTRVEVRMGGPTKTPSCGGITTLLSPRSFDSMPHSRAEPASSQKTKFGASSSSSSFRISLGEKVPVLLLVLHGSGWLVLQFENQNARNRNASCLR